MPPRARKSIAKTADSAQSEALKRQRATSSPPAYLGVECGGTKTAALLECAGKHLRANFGPGNLRLMDDRELLALLQSIRKRFTASSPRLAGVAVCMAGARTERDRARIRAAAAKIWPGVPCVPANDLEPALMAAGPLTIPRVLIVSGTGSCCYGKTPQGKTARVGGWGHLLGDRGSGYAIALKALQRTVDAFDQNEVWPPFGERVLRNLQLNEPDELIDWARNATKAEIAALASEVFGDKTLEDSWEGEAAVLAIQAKSCAARLAKKGESVEFILSGSVPLKQPRFVAYIERQIVNKCDWPKGTICCLDREAVWGALELARGGPREKPSAAHADEACSEYVLPTSPLSPTEQRNPRSMNLDKLPLTKAVALMVDEESGIGSALRAVRPEITRAVEMVVRAFRRKGRLFYAGAGTSGRLGVLDASECPPTFRVPPEQVQGIIAGGQTALWSAAEGAEDDPSVGAAAVAFRGVTNRDVVMGIAASGRTPFVWGALSEAKRRGAKTILLCFNPGLSIPQQIRPDLVIAPNVGPEFLTGSTRLKSGTATKIILNTVTTLAMTQMGKVAGNLMVDLNPSNVKLRDRAVRIVRELTGADAEKAQAALEKSKWVVKEALKRVAAAEH